MIVDEEINRQLQQIAIFLQEGVKQQLIDDGHRATGDLVDSIEAKVIRGSDVWTIEGSMLKYGQFVISGRERGKKGVPIDALIKWIENRNFVSGVKEVKGVAFAIQKSIKQKGIKADDFIGKVFDKQKEIIGNKLENAIGIALDLELTNLINNAKQFA